MDTETADLEPFEKQRREILRLHSQKNYRTARGLARDLASAVTEPSLKAGTQTASFIAQLAETLAAVGEGRWARVQLERALKLMERKEGPDHPEVARLLMIQANILSGFIYYPELDPILARALNILEKAHPPDHPEIGRLLLIWAELILKHWHPYLARPKARRAVEILRSAEGKRSPSVLRAREILTIASSKDLNHTVEELRKGLAERIQIQGEEHPDVLKSSQTLLEMTPDGDEAERLYGQTLALARHLVGDLDPKTALVHLIYAERVLKQQDTDRALPVLETALSILETAWAADHPDRMVVFGKLTMLFVFAERSPQILALKARLDLLKSDDRR